MTLIPQKRPNILVLVLDQWQTRMQLPPEVSLPALRRLESEGVSFDNTYCTVPLCTPSRAAMWTGQHAKNVNVWDNTNRGWLSEGLNPDIATVGDMLRDAGYYTVFKGKWHVSELERSENALERYGFSEYQQWGDMFGAPLEGVQRDEAATTEAIDWLEGRGKDMEQPWMMVLSLVNPHDIMWMTTDPAEIHAAPNGLAYGRQTTIQAMPWFQKEWNISLPDNFEDDLSQHPAGVKNYKEGLIKNFGQIPPERHDLWLKHRNYLVNCMRMVDSNFKRVLDALDRLSLWNDTVVIYVSDHGEMNGAHQLTQKGGICFDEAGVVSLIMRTPDGKRGERTGAVASLLDLVPTMLDFAGVSDEQMRQNYPQLRGHSLKGLTQKPQQAGPRGSSEEAGSGVLVMWDSLSTLDNSWKGLEFTANLGDNYKSPDEWREVLLDIGKEYGAPDMTRRNMMRYVVDGQYKLVRYFSPLEYSNPATVEELRQVGDLGLYDLKNDPGELDNLADPAHPRHDPAVMERMAHKLHALVRDEIGPDERPFDLTMFGEQCAALLESGIE